MDEQHIRCVLSASSSTPFERIQLEMLSTVLLQVSRHQLRRFLACIECMRSSLLLPMCAVSVRQSVCLSVTRLTRLRCAKTAEQIKMLFGVNTLESPLDTAYTGVLIFPQTRGGKPTFKSWDPLVSISGTTEDRDLHFCMLIEGGGPNESYAKVGHRGSWRGHATYIQILRLPTYLRNGYSHRVLRVQYVRCIRCRLCQITLASCIQCVYWLYRFGRNKRLLLDSRLSTRPCNTIRTLCISTNALVNKD